MISRRKFAFESATAVAALVMAPISFGLPRMESRPTPLNYAAFAGQIDTLFRVRFSPHQGIDLRLIKARLTPRPPIVPGRRPPVDADNEKFSLVFSGPRSSPLSAAIHVFEHPQLGRFEMYFGEIGIRDDDGVRYEAVFNQPPARPLNGASLT
jgi:hypothetical protein